jgi:hypothetical protein
MVVPGFGTAPPSADNPKIRAREQDKHLFIQKDFAARGNPDRRDRIVSRGEHVLRRKRCEHLQ